MAADGTRDFDVVVVGGGHNGLVAAGYLARAGLRVRLLERLGHVGGGAGSAPALGRGGGPGGSGSGTSAGPRSRPRPSTVSKSGCRGTRTWSACCRRASSTTWALTCDWPGGDFRRTRLTQLPAVAVGCWSGAPTPLPSSAPPPMSAVLRRST